MVVLKREAKLKLVITFQNDQNKQINERIGDWKLILLQAYRKSVFSYAC